MTMDSEYLPRSRKEMGGQLEGYVRTANTAPVSGRDELSRLHGPGEMKAKAQTVYVDHRTDR